MRARVPVVSIHWAEGRGGDGKRSMETASVKQGF